MPGWRRWPGLAVAIIAVSAIRRVYDARLYASMFEDVAGDVAARERAASSDVSVVAARAGLVEEIVAFFQESVPELTMGAVGILGTILILAGIDARLLVACIAAAGAGSGRLRGHGTPQPAPERGLQR